MKPTACYVCHDIEWLTEMGESPELVADRLFPEAKFPSDRMRYHLSKCDREDLLDSIDQTKST